MLSIIVSSYQQHYFEQFSENVKSTIGDDFEYEIIQQWNPRIMGICEAYNKGAEKAKYENLLFVHEDVLFETQNWGEKLINHLHINGTGVIGLAGSYIKTLFPIGWWDIKEGYANNLNQLNSKNIWVNNELYEDKPAIILDGVFMSIKKSIWLDYKFNIKNKSFHGYDVEFCLNVSKYFQNRVISNVKLKHLSQGNADVKWFNQLIEIYSNQKWIFYKNKFLYLEIEYFSRYLNKFNYNRFRKIYLFLKFYKPNNYSILESIKILKIFLHYF